MHCWKQGPQYDVVALSVYSLFIQMHSYPDMYELVKLKIDPEFLPPNISRYDVINEAMWKRSVMKEHRLENRKTDILGIFYVYYMTKNPKCPSTGLFSLTEPHLILYILRFLLPKFKHVKEFVTIEGLLGWQAKRRKRKRTNK
jgi:hypothetical protein